MQQLSEIDDFYRATLEAITNNELSDRSWSQASLPLTAAGLGIRKLVDLAHPAYFSSVHQSQDLSNRILARSNLSVLDDQFSVLLEPYPTEWIPPTPEQKTSQSAWDILKVNQIYGELLSSSGISDRARLLASSTKTSSKWLQAVPSPKLGLLLDNDSARIAVALRLGNKVCEAHTCVCGALVEPNGHHALSCILSKGKYVRHLGMNKIFGVAFRSAGLPNKLEPSGLSRRDGKRPDGLTCYPWSHGKSLIWDVTVVDTVAPSYLKWSSVLSGSVADNAEREKHNNYIDLKNQYIFTPLAFESFGAVGPETSVFLKKLGKLMSKNSGEPRSLDFLLQRISIAIQRGNSVCIRDTFGENSCDIFV